MSCIFKVQIGLFPPAIFARVIHGGGKPRSFVAENPQSLAKNASPPC
jgi:hypothetical protein